MAERAHHSVIRRKVAARQNAAPVNARVLPAKALSAAVSKTAEASAGLTLGVGSCSESIASLPDLLERLPEDGLLALLEGPKDCQGLVAFDAGLMSAIIEVQMTGMVSPAPPSPRRATRTDAALAADLIDAMLQRFETALAGREESRWAAGFGYASHVEDMRPLGLLMEEIDYRIFGLVLDIDGGTRDGRMLLALPAEGRGPPPPPEAKGARSAKAAEWASGLERRLLDGEVQLDAVLHRLRLPISAIGRMRPGDEIPIPVSAIDNVLLAGAERIPLGRCRLGRSLGKRALRLGVEGVNDPAPPLASAVLPGPRKVDAIASTSREGGAGAAPETAAPSGFENGTTNGGDRFDGAH